MARLTDELFLAGKIKKELYENLNSYRAKRNEIIHRILKCKGEKQFEKELKVAYQLGVGMKVFIVEEMMRMHKGRTISEISAKLERDLSDRRQNFQEH